ncbi:arabinofuranosidase catalytic domain-containing protein [Saccharothrix hoggarensis]|uniref:Arabinofuranosidase catalytic domain-containing protein n=1 Tax=Saccharothrix hoggarensis TaxID=913853 RepID=A0ABW3QST2_9PSEU
MEVRAITRVTVAFATGIALTAVPFASPANGATEGPCDIYAASNTPCVAAHSTTRALYGAYNGPLYQVRRSSDNATRDIGPLTAGGVANAATQDSFCAGTTCLITVLYDQSGRGNHLTQAPPGDFLGPAPGGYDNLAVATAAPVTVGGQKAYGVFISPGTGYRNNRTNGIATGDQPEGIYAVLDGTHYSDGCCFDYGNAQTDGKADRQGIMETVYFGSNNWWGSGDGPGPWVMADLEWGLFSGVNPRYNPNPTITHRFVTAIVKGEPNHWAIRSGNAQSGGLSTTFDGPRPNGYHPMQKEGGILLGIGGDNSIGGAGTFYEGVMTSGYPTNATEDAVQANIAAAGYAAGSVAPVNRIQSYNFPDRYIRHVDFDARIDPNVNPAQDAQFRLVPGLAGAGTVSFQSVNYPRHYLRHSGFDFVLAADDGSATFKADTAFRQVAGLADLSWSSFQSYNFPDRYIRHQDYQLRLHQISDAIGRADATFRLTG